MISCECRRNSNETVNKQRRYQQIREVLKANGPLTAKEVAVEMYKLGYVNSTERNWSAPRLTELEMRYRLVHISGKKKCNWTGKTVSVYELIDDENEWKQMKMEACV